jgi:hypothetical protein
MSFGVSDQRTLWPGYVYPDVWNGDACAWFRFGDEAQAGADGSGSIAVANPASGPGTAVVSDWTAAINYVRDKGHKVVGYVHTSYGARAIADVKAEVDAWYDLYGPDGIFVDEMSNDAATSAYYRDLYVYVATKQGAHLVVGNPGAAATTDWQLTAATKSADILVIFEGTEAAYTAWTPPTWTGTYTANRLAHLVHTVTSGSATAALTHAQATKAGYRYVTDDVMPNPWDTLAFWPAQATP